MLDRRKVRVFLFILLFLIPNQSFAANAGMKIGIGWNNIPSYIFPASWNTSFAGTPLDLTGYHQTFSEIFSTNDICANGTSGCNWYAPAKPQYGDATFQGIGSTYVISGNKLTMATVNTSGVWSAGSIQSVDYSGNNGFSQSLGYFEASMQLPYVSGSSQTGTWPAFWLLGVNNITNPYAQYPELDVIEAFGSSPSLYSCTTHLWQRQTPPAPNINYSVNFSGTQTIFDGTYHKFGILITPTLIIDYLDRIEVARYNAYPQDSQPMYMLITNALETLPEDTITRNLLVNNVQAWSL